MTERLRTEPGQISARAIGRLLIAPPKKMAA
jgi:hypothetical protein